MRLAALALIFAASAAFLSLEAQQAPKAPVPVILSTDTGNEVDDQWVILYLLTDPAFDVRGLLSAQAPTLPDPSAHWTLGVLRDEVENHMGLTVHPPLVEGASTPMQDASTPQPSDAARFLVEQSKGFSSTNRLTVLTIGAATDTASALLLDPTLADRIRIVAMGFTNLQADGAEEFNVLNDPHAWQTILTSRVPVVIGTGEVCRHDLSMGYAQAQQMLANHGPIGAWLWDEYQMWYFSHVKPRRVADFTNKHVIWDIITAAYARGLVTTQTVPRPSLTDHTRFAAGQSGAMWETITHVDTVTLWKDFFADLDHFTATHSLPPYQPR
ncbi:nucleoside hydrolase [Terriglobus sp. ADX1]|uniref:nucleoside hydrolase n=1 Tax=Terriglobus sp. ADX1 TaxID=2794063 RepID=UPI002FE52FC1